MTQNDTFITGHFYLSHICQRELGQISRFSVNNDFNWVHARHKTKTIQDFQLSTRRIVSLQK